MEIDFLIANVNLFQTRNALAYAMSKIIKSLPILMSETELNGLRL
jgi:hypothetical protein